MEKDISKKISGNGSLHEINIINNDGDDDDSFQFNSVQFISFIYVLDNSQIWPVTAKHKNSNRG
jgi:hypothetical protein